MKKLLTVLGVIAALLLIAYIGLSFFLGSIVKTGVNTFAPKITGTKVELAGATISPLGGGATLTGLAVGNPKGWSDNNLFYLGKVSVKLRPLSVLGDHIVIDEIFIDEPQVRYETKIVSSNVGDLLKAVEAATGSKDAQPTTKSGKPLKFEVKHFRMQNGKVAVGTGAAAIPLPLPPIDLTDLGTKEGGITPDQLAVAIMRSVSTSVVGATTKAAAKLGATMGAAAGDATKKATEGLKKLFGGGK